MFYGSPFYYTSFYNIKSEKLSNPYDTPVLAYKNKVIYVDNNRLIIRDIFNKKKYYKVIERKFTETVPPSSAIRSITYISNLEIELEYYSGKDYTKYEETIDLNKEINNCN